MQKLKIKLQIVVFLEFWVVFTVSSFVRNLIHAGLPTKDETVKTT